MLSNVSVLSYNGTELSINHNLHLSRCSNKSILFPAQNTDDIYLKGNHLCESYVVIVSN